MRKLTEIEFIVKALRISREASAWAANTALDIQTNADPVGAMGYPKTEDVARFTDQIRSILDLLDELAGREALNQEDRDD